MRSSSTVLSFAAARVTVEPGCLSPAAGFNDLDRRLNEVFAALDGVPRALELADVAMQLHHRLLEDAMFVQSSAARAAA